MSALLGYDVTSSDYIITVDNVKHIMDQHGNDAAEVQRGNLPLSSISMDDIADVVAYLDRITLGAEEDWKAGRSGIQFEKDIGNGTVVYVQFDNFKRGTIELRAMYIRKGTSTSTVNVADTAASTYTSKAIEPEVPINSIPHSGQSINSEKIPTDIPADSLGLVLGLGLGDVVKGITGNRSANGTGRSRRRAAEMQQQQDSSLLQGLYRAYLESAARDGDIYGNTSLT